MNRDSFIITLPARIEYWLVGPLDSDVRRDVHVDIRAACTHSVIATILNFIPIILRRLGASNDQVAYYFAVTSIGLLTTGISVRLMRHWGMKRVALVVWLLGRGSFLLTAFALDSTALLLILSFFWL